MTIHIDPPTTDFSSAYAYDVQHYDGDDSMLVDFEIDFSNWRYEDLNQNLAQRIGTDQVEVQLRALANYTAVSEEKLALGESTVKNITELTLALGQYRVEGDYGLAELWFSPRHSTGTFLNTTRAQPHAFTPSH